MREAGYVIRDLADHAPGHALIVKLLTEWDAGRIRLDEESGEVVIDDDSRGWYWGVLGERAVAGILSYLGPEYTVLHSVPLGAQGADVDHLVIGPSGVFTINTKYHPGASIWTAGHGLHVNGVGKRYLHSSAGEAGRVEAKLSAAAGFAVPVLSVIAFVDASTFRQTAPNEIDGVPIEVVPAEQLLTVICGERQLNDAQVTRIAEVARKSSTWQKTLRPSAPGAHLVREFDALNEALGPSLNPDYPVRAATPTARRSQRPRTPKPAIQPGASSRVAAVILSGCLGLLFLPIALTLLGWAASAVLGALLPR
ncbi:nuclease-related domain-containing protein [Protaetiibacter larvae]|uniref:nuclease-related domain-containing protein n=1 Tax=Protaetiibacter larvae TaxID=2592654 RepID=UPI00143D5C6B|nr:nuclease-related domain-containing protein [Protaetiibacter larvae]